MKTNLDKDELKLLYKMIALYWDQNNNEHEDNLEDWRTTFNIIRKIIW